MASPQLENIGLALQGFSAGLGGQLPQFQQMQNQRIGLEQNQQQVQIANQEKMQAMAIERQKTVYTDANAALQLAQSGDMSSVVKLGINRLQMLKQLSQLDPSIDPSDTQRVTQLAVAARNGNQDAKQLLIDELTSTVNVGKAIGILQDPESEEFTLSPGETRFRGSEQIAAVPSVTEEFELVTPEMATQMGLPLDKQFQRNKQTSQISQVGSGPAVQVNTGEMSAGMKAADSAFATGTYLPWITGGGADTIGQIANLMPVLEKLEKSEPITGAVIAALPEWYKTFTPAGVESIDAKNLVQQVVQRNLREILGAQFTALEGENLIKRAYNEALPPEKNLPRLKKLIQAIQQGAEQKNAMVEYFQKNGTISGYRGKLPALQDFYDAIGDDQNSVDDPLGIMNGNPL